MASHLRIQDGKVAVVQDGRRLGPPISQAEFIARIVRHRAAPESFFPLHKSARFFSFEGSRAVLVLELEPDVHTFRWIKDVSGGPVTASVGERAEYETRALALPYVVLVLPFVDGVLQNQICQVFYRTSSLKGLQDQLFQTNLLNVAEGYGFTNWLCMVGYTQQQGLSWQDAIEEAIRYFFWSAFNRSSEIHERNSHYGTARKKKYDAKIASAAAWEQHSAEDPRFMLEIRWPRTGHTVKSAMELAVSRLPGQGLNLTNLVLREDEEK